MAPNNVAHARFDDSGLGEAPKPTVHRSDTQLIKALQPVTVALNRHLIFILASALFSVLTTTSVVLSRPSHVEGSELVDSRGNVIGTGHTTETLDMVEIVSVRDPEFYDDIESVLLEDSSGSLTSLRISSWTWHNASRMQLGAMNGADILIDAGTVAVAGPVDTLLTFSADGTASAVGLQALGADEKLAPSMANARGRCLSLGCPFSHCSAGLAAEGLVREAGCNGRPLWRWPQGVSLANGDATRRSLQGVGKWKVNKKPRAGKPRPKAKAQRT